MVIWISKLIFENLNICYTKLNVTKVSLETISIWVSIHGRCIKAQQRLWFDYGTLVFFSNLLLGITALTESVNHLEEKSQLKIG